MVFSLSHMVLQMEQYTVTGAQCGKSRFTANKWEVKI